MDYEIERENNIIKNIANEIVYECSKEGYEISQELASYVVKLKLLNPKLGFTASKVMPRSLTQQLVELVVQDLKQDTPAMDIIRMQVYWSNAEMNMNELKSDYAVLMAEKAEPYLNEILRLEQEDIQHIQKLLSQYILVHQNLKNVNYQMHLRETMAALQSIVKSKELSVFVSSKQEEKIIQIKTFVRRVTGIRLFLKYSGKAGEGLEEVKDLMNKIEMGKEGIIEFMRKLSTKIKTLREVISNSIPIDLFRITVRTGEVNLPPECELSDLVYLKKILAIMLQHGIYLSDVLSKIEEIDATVNSMYTEYEDTLERLKQTIRDREAVPTVEVFDDFDKVGDFWESIQSCFYCFECVNNIAKKLELINQEKYFAQTLLEKLTLEKLNVLRLNTPGMNDQENSNETVKSPSVLFLHNSEDFSLEFNGFCAWNLYYAEGFLVPGVPEAGIFQSQDKYYSFEDSRLQEAWKENPEYFLLEIYEYLRVNPEMIDLLNAYENLYNIRTLILIQDEDRKIASQSEYVQTEVHPIPEFWDKDYTFSIWELKKRALTLSRLVKCVTKSAQTISPHSHFRASIGILAAPDKDKESQTKRDSSCNHSTIANYLYGLRGHREDKFRVIELTRPIDESYESKIILGEEDLCRERRKPPESRFRQEVCYSTESDDVCYADDFSGEYNEEF